MVGVSEDGIRARAAFAHDELVKLVDDVQGLAPSTRLAVLVALVRASAELRLRAERAIGQVLVDYPDPGGRPSKCRPTPVGRSLRRQLGLNRTVCSWLARLAVDVDDARLAALVDELWDGYPSVGKVSARSVVLGELADPPPSSEGCDGS